MKWLDRNAMPPLPYYTLVKNERQWKQATKHIGIDNPPPMVAQGADGATHTATNDKGEMVCIVAITNYRHLKLHEIYSLLVHEAVHIWQEYRDNKIRESNPCKELEAYVIQRIALELMSAFRGKRNR